MQKTTATRSKQNHNGYNLYADLEKIRDAFVDTAYDVRGKTGEMLAESVDGLKEKSIQLRDGVAGYAADKPFKTIIGMFALGIATCYFFTKK